ncbi:MAG: YceD family protein [Gemmobacter sp.]
MQDLLPVSHPVRLAEVSGRRERRFDLRPDAAQRTDLARVLGVADLSDLRFSGSLRASGARDIALVATLRAELVQACVVTLADVPCHIEVPVQRLYVAGMEEPTETETEMPEDDTREPLPEVLDLGAVMIEALALALPDYPRAPGVELGEAVFAAPGVVPLRDRDLNPFAALARLRRDAKDGE